LNGYSAQYVPRLQDIEIAAFCLPFFAGWKPMGIKYENLLMVRRYLQMRPKLGRLRY